MNKWICCRFHKAPDRVLAKTETNQTKNPSVLLSEQRPQSPALGTSGTGGEAARGSLSLLGFPPEL